MTGIFLGLFIAAIVIAGIKIASAFGKLKMENELLQDKIIELEQQRDPASMYMRALSNNIPAMLDSIRKVKEETPVSIRQVCNNGMSSTEQSF